MTQACSTLSHIYYLTDTEHTPGTRCQWKAQSGMSKTALTLFSSLGLWSPAVLDGLSALKSSLALLACQAAEGTNGYLRSAAPLPPTMATPPPSPPLPRLLLLLLLHSAPHSLLFSMPPVLILFTTSCFSSLRVAADHQALFLLLSRLPED